MDHADLSKYEIVEILSHMSENAVGRTVRPGVEIDGIPRPPSYDFVASGPRLLHMLAAGTVDLQPDFRNRITWEYRAKTSLPKPVPPAQRAALPIRQTVEPIR